MLELGNIAEDATLDFMWGSNDGSGGAVTRSTDGTISVYKGNSVTQSVAGVTDTEDFDSLTGVHHCRIDTSADAFYEVGYDYVVVLSAATIDSQTVNAPIARFSIENRRDESFIDTILTRVSANVALASTALTSATWTDVRAGYLDNINGHTPQTGDSFARLGAPAGASIAADVAAILTTALTESYAADGAEGTAAQLLYWIQQMLTELSFSSTTGTVKKLDGSTTAGTVTVNDASNPTSITRAT